MTTRNTKKSGEEYVKMIIGAFLTLLTGTVVGLFVWVFAMHANSAVQAEKILKLEESQKEVVKALNKNTEALSELRATLETIRGWPRD